jgi:hypothetical protein
MTRHIYSEDRSVRYYLEPVVLTEVLSRPLFLCVLNTERYFDALEEHYID